MFKKLLLIVGLLAIMLMSCSPKHSEVLVAKYGDDQIQMDEFEKAYAKNVGSFDIAKKDSVNKLRDFLDLYTVYKMKLKDAASRGFDKDSATTDELESYRKTIGASYYLENELYEKGVKDLYNKRSEELRISHLLIRTDTLTVAEAEKKCDDIINKVKQGEKFEDLVKLHTDDKFSRDKGGDIYYITAGTIIPEFEDAAYSTPIGTVNSTPVKTKYGYHIIKVTNKMKRIPQIKASHILIRTKDNEGKPDSVGKLKLTQELLARIKSGEDFGKLASEYSDDPGSKTKNGELGYFARRQMVQSFDEAAFNLKVGEVSDIIDSRFGYHIIKLLDKKQYPSYEDEKKQVRELYEKTRKNSERAKLVKTLSEEMGYVLYDNGLKNIAVQDTFNTALSSNYWESDYRNLVKNTDLFEINKVKYSLDDLVENNIKNDKDIGKKINQQLVQNLIKTFKDNKVIELKASKVLAQNDSFINLMNEYKNGIYIFKLQEDEVWSKMDLDSSRINALYEKTKENYIFPDQAEFLEIFSRKDSLINVYYTQLQDGEDFENLAKKNTERIKFKTKAGNQGMVELSKSELAKQAFELDNLGDYSKVFKYSNGWSIVKLVNKIESREKTFAEARAEVTSKFQDMESLRLEKEYKTKLEKTYNPKLFYDELNNAYKAK
ncbi:MAG: hypothetical protein GY936_02345 [Ignavibacteriae bacterium]|nr:hypothetical protein [Ignavibacteriota bacterium]